MTIKTGGAHQQVSNLQGFLASAKMAVAPGLAFQHIPSDGDVSLGYKGQARGVVRESFLNERTVNN